MTVSLRKRGVKLQHDHGKKEKEKAKERVELNVCVKGKEFVGYV